MIIVSAMIIVKWFGPTSQKGVKILAIITVHAETDPPMCRYGRYRIHALYIYVYIYMSMSHVINVLHPGTK